MIKIKNRCCYTVTLILCGTLFLTGLTGCKSREAQFLIEGLQEAKAEVDAESSEEKTSGQKSKKDTDEKKADTEDRQNDGGNSGEFRKKQAESDGSDAGNGTGSDSGKHTSDADIDNGSEAVSDKEAKIKWVNDIYCDNKKVCGILTEASFDFESGIIDYAVLGIGINVRIPKEGFAEEIKDVATGIFEYETSTSTDIRSKLIAEILRRFWHYYKHIEDKSFLESYKSRSILINKEVNILSSKSSEKATVLEIDNDCRLKVQMEDGSIRLLSSGEVSIRM